MKRKLWMGIAVLLSGAVGAFAQNQPPTFSRGTNVVIAENSAAVSISGWTTTFSAGSTSEDTSQTVTFEVLSNDNPYLFKIQPSFSVQMSPKNATLNFTPAANAIGTAMISVRAKDDSNSGNNTSASQIFYITINPSSSAAFTESPSVLRTNTVLSAGMDRIQDLFVDPAGNIYVTGYSVNTNIGRTDFDYVTMKIHGRTGTNMWVARYDGTGSGNDQAQSIAVDSFGNAYVTGTSAGTGNDDIVTIKYDGNTGASVWTTRYNGTMNGSDRGVAIGLDSSFNAYVTGISAGIGTGDDIVTLKYNGSGMQSWEARYNGSGNLNEKSTALAVDASGNSYVAGSSREITGGDDLVVLKYNTSGVASWTNRYDGPGHQTDRALGVTLDSSGTVYVTGVSFATVTKEDMVTQKLNGSTGSPVWTKRFDGASGYDEGRKVKVDLSGQVYVAGVSFGAASDDDIVVVKYGPDGTQVWAQRFDGVDSGPDEPTGLAIDHAGDVYVAGVVFSSLTGDDFQVVKYTAAGALAWSRSFDGNVGNDMPLALGIGRFGQTIAAGYSDYGATGTDYQTLLYLFGEAVPTTANDAYPVFEDQLLTVAAPGVLGNDSDPDNGALRAVLVETGTTNGTLTLNADGSFTYRGNTNFNGTDSFKYVAMDYLGHTSAETLVSLTINPVNDSPSFTKGADQTVLEDAGAQTVNSWATSIKAGPDNANETGQTVAFLVTTDNDALFAALPAVSSAGALTYQPAVNANGTATVTVRLQDNGGTANGGQDTSPAQTFTITVTAVNDSPSFTKGADQTVGEDAGAQTVNGWATSISPGPANESSQTVSFIVTNNNNGLFSVQPAVSAAGNLTFTPAANSNGTATVTVTAQDSGGTANGGQNQSVSQTFTITVTAVNDAPSFTKGSNQTVLEDASAASVSNWATGVSFGPADEQSSQAVLAYIVSNNNSNLFEVQPAIATNGTLTFKPVANSNGTATVTVQLQDNGGTAGGGNDTSTAQTFTITVTAVNDAPSFTAGSNQTVAENAGPQSVSWATQISAGPADEAGQTLTFVVTNSNNGLFSVQPSISSSGVLTYTPNSNSNGMATVSVILQDNGGTANGGANQSAEKTFTIQVTSVDNPPVPGPDTTVASRNEILRLTTASLLANDTDADSTNLTITAVSANSTAGGTVTLSGSEVRYLSKTNYTGADSFTYTLSDGTSSVNGTVSVTVTPPFRGPPLLNQEIRGDVSNGMDVAEDMAVDSSGNIIVTGYTYATATGYDFVTMKFNASGTRLWTKTFNNSGTGDDLARSVAVDGSGNIYVTGRSTRSLAADMDYVTIKYDGSGAPQWTNRFNGTGSADDFPFKIAIVGSDVIVTGYSDNGATGHDIVTLRLRGSNGNQLWSHTYNGTSSLSDEPRGMVVDSSGNVFITGITTGSASGEDALTYKLNGSTGALVWDKVFTSSGSQSDQGLALALSPLGNVVVAGTTYGGNTTRGDYLLIKYDGSNGTQLWQKGYNGPGNNVDVARAVAVDTYGYVYVTGASRGVGSGDDIATLKFDFDGNALWTNRFNGTGNGADSGRAIYIDASSDVFVAGDSLSSSNAVDIVVLKYDVNGTQRWNTSYDGPAAAGADFPVAMTGNSSGQIFVGGYSEGSGTDLDMVVLRYDHRQVPLAANDLFTATEDTTLNVSAPGVLQNDSPVDEDPIRAVVVANPQHGTLTLNSDGSFQYVPAANYSGPDSFTYTANDSKTNSTTGSVSITVTAVNDAPVAVADSYSGFEDTILNVSAPGLLANDTDIETNALTAILVTQAAHGTVTVNANGSFSYTPAANYNGPDSFTYKANDGSADSAPVAVSLAIAAVNDAPTAAADAYETDEDTTLNVAAPGVLSNDGDVDGDAITAVVSAAPSHGTLTLNANGSFTYTPAANYNGPDSFTYRANDGLANSGLATVTLTVKAVNDAPVGAADSYSVNEDTTLNVAAPGVLANDSDADGNTLTVSVGTGPAHGALTLNPNGSFSYLPATNYSGSDSFTYVVNDGTVNSSPVTVSLTVVPVNDAPVSANDIYSTPEDTVLTVAAPGVLSNDSDVESDPLTAAVVNPPEHGSLTLNANGSFVYTPATNFHGTDSFTYRASDGQASSLVAAVTLEVTSVNDAPVSSAKSYTTLEDQALTVAAPGVLANDTDADGDSLTAVLNSSPTHGSITLNPDGSFTYTPNANFNGTDSFDYQSNDGTEKSAPRTVTITITALNDAPTFTAGANQTVDEDAAAQVVTGWASAISAGPSDESSQTVTFEVSNSNNALFSTQPAVDAAGKLTYQTATNAHGSATVSVRLVDDGGTDNGGTNASPVSTFTITVNAVNDSPTLASPIADLTVPESTADSTVDLSATFADADIATDSDTLTLTVGSNSNPTLVTATLTGTSLHLVYASGQKGSSDITIRATDAAGAFVEDTFTVTVEDLVEPFIQGVTVTGSDVTVTWQSTVGKKYRLQYRTDFNVPGWTDVAGDIDATDTTASKTDSGVTGAVRFYRVVLLTQ